MRRTLNHIFTALLSIAVLAPSLWSQTPGDPYILDQARIQPSEKVTWNVFGKVTDLKGQPVRGAAVIVDIGMGQQYAKQLTADLQGEFETRYEMPAASVKRFEVHLTVRAAGYHDAYQFVTFGAGETWEIDVTLRPAREAADELTVESLVETLGPSLAQALRQDPGLASSRKDLDKGTAAFLDNDQATAIPSLQKVVDHHADCGHCRTLLGLAMLAGGNWNGAGAQFLEADKLAQSKGTAADKAQSLLIVGKIANWKGDYDKAAGFLMQAKDLDPKNGLILQELGRTLIFQKNWEAADQYLAEATKAGAAKEALLLRVRALLEEGDPESASEAMKTYLGGSNLRTFPIAVRSLDAQIEARMSMRSYGKVDSVATEPLPSLVAAVPELKGLEAALNQSELAGILLKTGEGVRSFFGTFQNTASVEEIREERLAKDGKARDVLNEKFQYLLLLRPEKWGLGLEEFRTNSHGDRTTPGGLDSGLMVTSGFASASLIFHPAYQSGAAFRYLGRQTLNGHDCQVIAFAQDPRKAQMVERFNTSNDSVLVLFQGLAWIDSATYEIVRLRTDLLTPQTKIRLQRQTTEITYDPVQFKQVASALWLPSEVAVTLQWAGKTYRNTHHYSGFRLFNTATQEKIGQPSLPAETEEERQPKR
jgi:tetratricopeptide (TPR) repeat protein